MLTGPCGPPEMTSFPISTESLTKRMFCPWSQYSIGNKIQKFFISLAEGLLIQGVDFGFDLGGCSRLQNGNVGRERF